jgi:Flp pilus assembly protein TadD
VSSETFDLYRLARLAQDYLEAGNPREAVATLDYALRDLPDDRGLQRLQAQALFAFASLGRAESLLRELLEDDPTDPELLVLLARTLQRRGQRDEAAAVHGLLRAMGLDPLSGAYV